VLFGPGGPLARARLPARAVDDLEQALSLDPKARVLHYPLAMAYRGMGNSNSRGALRQRGLGEILPPDPP
jgi:hypothetical protein